MPETVAGSVIAASPSAFSATVLWYDAAGDPVGVDGFATTSWTDPVGVDAPPVTVTWTVPEWKKALVEVAAPSSTPLDANGLMVSSVLAFFTPQRPVVVPVWSGQKPAPAMSAFAVALVHTQPVLEKRFSSTPPSLP